MGSKKRIYKAEEVFEGSALNFVKAIENRNSIEIKKIIASSERIEINQPVKLPGNFNFHKIDHLSFFDILLGNALTPAPYTGGYSGETITILNYFIANNDLNSITEALKLGADPKAQGTWYYDSYFFSCRFKRPEALNIILEDTYFLAYTSKASFIDKLPIINTVNHWFSETEYKLDPQLLEVALKHKVNFDILLPEWGGSTMLTNNMSLNGYGTVIWLLEHNAARPDLPDKDGKTIISITNDWLKGVKPDDKYRKSQLLKIKNLLIEKGFNFPQ